MPRTSKEIRLIDVKKLRQSLRMSQPQFALNFGFNLDTLRKWEQGRRQPDDAARSFLMVISRSPEAVMQALSAAA
jgi:putative transcriptional regulator